MAALYRQAVAAIKFPNLNRVNIHRILTCKYSSDVDKKIEERESWATLSDNGSVIACWHPEQKFPYEHSKPLPLFPPEFNETDSVLNVQHRMLYKYRLRPEGPMRHELQKITFTTKHGWFPNNRGPKEARKKKPRPNRDFL